MGIHNSIKGIRSDLLNRLCELGDKCINIIIRDMVKVDKTHRRNIRSLFPFLVALRNNSGSWPPLTGIPVHTHRRPHTP
jgi:hypothetical protein